MKGERVCPRRAEGRSNHVAQLLPLCRASHLAEARRLAAPWQGAPSAKTRASSSPSRAHGHYLRPSTNYEKLSDVVYRSKLGQSITCLSLPSDRRATDEGG